MECMFEILKDFRQGSNRILVLFALEYLVDGIQGCVKREFELFHDSLKEKLKHLDTQCPKSCSKDETKSVAAWCVTCAGWRTAILSRHKNRTEMAKNNICWLQFESSKWPTDPSEVERCFSAVWCFESNRSDSSCNDNDVAVILRKIINCTDVHAKFDIKVKPQTLIDIRNQVAHARWISNARKVEYCEAIRTFLFTHLDNQSAQNVYDKTQILKEKSYNEIISYNLISAEEVNKMQKRINTKVDLSKVNLGIIAILCICIALIAYQVMLFKIDHSIMLSGSLSTRSSHFTGKFVCNDNCDNINSLFIRRLFYLSKFNLKPLNYPF